MDGDGVGKWLFIGLGVGAVFMVALYGLPEHFFGVVAPDCRDGCVKDLAQTTVIGEHRRYWCGKSGSAWRSWPGGALRRLGS